MDRVCVLKSLLTKAWNSGKYSSFEDFHLFLKTEFMHKYNDAVYYYVDLVDHICSICNNPPQMKKVVRSKQKYDKYFVYFYIIDDIFHPVYIGKTYDIDIRFIQHKREDNRYDNVKYIFYCEFDTEQDALDFEAYYIRYLQPEWNISGKSEPSKLYKLPAQKIAYWCVTRQEEDESFNSFIVRIQQNEKKYEYVTQSLLPEFQKLINSISL